MIWGTPVIQDFRCRFPGPRTLKITGVRGRREKSKTLMGRVRP